MSLTSYRTAPPRVIAFFVWALAYEGWADIRHRPPAVYPRWPRSDTVRTPQASQLRPIGLLPPAQLRMDPMDRFSMNRTCPSSATWRIWPLKTIVPSFKRGRLGPSLGFGRSDIFMGAWSSTQRSPTETSTAPVAALMSAFLAGIAGWSGKRVAAANAKPNSLVTGGFSS
jgi:hypothetical protein